MRGVLLVGWVLLGGCPGGPGGEADPQRSDTGDLSPLLLVDGPHLQPPEDPDIHLMRQLVAETDRPAVLSWQVEDGRVRTTSAAASRHELPVLGLLPDRTQQVTLTWTDPDGAPALERTVEVTTGPLPEELPVLEILADDPARRSPGWTLFIAEHPTGTPTWVTLLLDEDLELAWLQTGSSRLWAATATGEGTRVGLSRGLDGFAEEDWSGRVLRNVASEVAPLHHELVPFGDGAWSLTYETVQVDAYPTGEADPSITGPAEIRDTPVVRLDGNGRVVSSWSLAERLDTQRVSYDAMIVTPYGHDWSHANGIALHPDGGMVVSVRQQDVLARLSATGDLLWLLGDPAGWGPDHAERLLDPVGDWPWPYHTHAPAYAEDGTLWVFDNHNHGATIYTGADGTPQWSRVVGYQIDEEAGTVTQIASLDQTTTGRLFALALGDADPLPGGTILGVWGNTHEEEGTEPGTRVDNRERGWGRRVARLVELDPDRPTEPAFDLRVRDDGGVGWTVYRAQRVVSPWGDVAR